MFGSIFVKVDAASSCDSDKFLWADCLLVYIVNMLAENIDIVRFQCMATT
jgi:hypothetical protein